MFTRQLHLTLPKHQSAFLWGARQTGKSSYLKQHFPQALYYDLLDTHTYARFLKAPYLLREEILALPQASSPPLVIIDEVQKVPQLLNEVHWLIENAKIQFILCGSSARRLKTHSTNLLGGRAWQYHFYPLTFAEIPDFDLLRALCHGLIPNHYLSLESHIADHLQAYVELYLTDEIRNEGLVRNLAGFARFLDVVGICNGEMINFNSIARDCGIDRNTVHAYYQILVDTLLGYFLYPFRKRIKRDLITATPKFYLFDVGIAHYLARNQITALAGSLAGKRFEHYIFMELMAYRSLSRKRFEISYWRTKTGIEVDFILGQAEVALEVKISTTVRSEDLKGIHAFCQEHPHAKGIIISQDPRARKMSHTPTLNLILLPWRDFLEKLWANEII